MSQNAGNATGNTALRFVWEKPDFIGDFGCGAN
jgi:hypothetical protein